jgi:hypothetical protein
MDVAGIVFIGLHCVLLVGMLSAVAWLRGQRARGWPDPRARAVDRPAVLAALGACYVFANLVLLIGAAIAFDLDLFARPGLP